MTKVLDMELQKNMKLMDIIDGFRNTSYNARKLATAADIWLDALQTKARIYFSLAGAMTPAGLRRVVAKCIDNEIIDVLITTAANMMHDALQGAYSSHEIGSEHCNDLELRGKGIWRIYDTYLSEKDWEHFDNWLCNEFYPSFVGTHKSTVVVRPTEFFEKLGAHLHDLGDNGILATAYSKKVQIYTPAYVDSDFGLALHLANTKLKEKHGTKVVVDTMGDLSGLIHDVESSKNRCVVIVGGGAPKNFILQSSLLPKAVEKRGFDYGIQLTTDSPQWGGLSGATLQEAVSWGKMRTGNFVTVYSDAVITLPLLVGYVLEKRTMGGENEKKKT
jgi:deoxyhypusine synthase